ncbi:hypothetical protein AB4212_53955, partial [Streptomyces sp. 2MCAF27]
PRRDPGAHRPRRNLGRGAPVRLGGIRAHTGLGGTSGEEHQFEFVGAGTVLLQSTEEVMDGVPIGTTGGTGS